MIAYKKIASAFAATVMCIVLAVSVFAADELKITASSTGGYELKIDLENTGETYIANVDVKVDGAGGKDGTVLRSIAPGESVSAVADVNTGVVEYNIEQTDGDVGGESNVENGTSIHTIYSMAPGESATIYASMAGGSESEPVKVMPANEIPAYTIWIGLGIVIVFVAVGVIIIRVKKKKGSHTDVASIIVICILLTALVSGDNAVVYAAAGDAGYTEQTVKMNGKDVVVSADYTVVPAAVTEPLKNTRRAPDSDECNTPAVNERRLVENAGPMTEHSIYIGKNDFMFFGTSIDDYTGNSVMSGSRLNKIAKMMNDRDAWAKENDIKLYLVIAPNKSSVYPEYVPEKLTAADKTNADVIVEHLAENSTVEVIDLRQPLIDAKAEYGDTLFYKYDTHWNNNGGFVGYSEIMRRINEDVPGAYTLEKSDFNIEEQETYMKDMAYYLGYYNRYTDFGPVYTLKSGMTATIGETEGDGYWGQFRFCARWQDGYSDALKYITYENTYNSDAPSVYVYRDSFAVSMVHFLKDSFHNSVFNWTYDFSKQEILDSGADIVIMEVVEKQLYDFTNSRTFSN